MLSQFLLLDSAEKTACKGFAYLNSTHGKKTV